MELDGEAVVGAEAFGELFGEEDGTVLAAGAAERDHEAFEATGLVVGDAGVDERVNAGEELVNAFLLTEIVDYGRVPAGEFLEFFVAARIGEETRNCLRGRRDCRLLWRCYGVFQSQACFRRRP